jgi:hypothetical protein
MKIGDRVQCKEKKDFGTVRIIHQSYVTVEFDDGNVWHRFPFQLELTQSEQS